MNRISIPRPSVILLRDLDRTPNLVVLFEVSLMPDTATFKP